MNKEIRTENANADPNKKLAVISVISVIIAVLIAVIFILLPKQAASGDEAKTEKTCNEYGNVLTVTEKDNLSETENMSAYTYEGFRISYEPYKENYKRKD